MEESVTKEMTITVDKATGNFVKVVDEEGREGTPVDPKKLKEIYESKEGFKYVAMILHAHSSPGCWYYFVAGRWYVFCIPQ